MPSDLVLLFLEHSPDFDKSEKDAIDEGEEHRANDDDPKEENELGVSILLRLDDNGVHPADPDEEDLFR